MPILRVEEDDRSSEQRLFDEAVRTRAEVHLRDKLAGETADSDPLKHVAGCENCLKELRAHSKTCADGKKLLEILFSAPRARPMTRGDRHTVIDWIGMLSPKGIMESTKIGAEREQIQAFLDEIHTHLMETYLESTEPNRTCKLVGCSKCGGSGLRTIKRSCEREMEP